MVVPPKLVAPSATSFGVANGETVLPESDRSLTRLVDFDAWRTNLCTAYRVLHLARLYVPEHHGAAGAEFEAASAALEALLLAAQVPVPASYHRHQAERIYRLAVSARVRRIIATDPEAGDHLLPRSD